MFINEEHKERFYKYIERDGTPKEELDRMALFYILSKLVNEKGIELFYDFNSRLINPEYLEKVHLSSGEKRMIKLAFNLYNGYKSKDDCQTVYDTFYNLDPYNLQVAINGIQIRFRMLDVKGEFQ
ncbi:DUF6075 family protein [Natranaerobius trueperi]|uniref:Uncharacterized protein n=1 Tax=Natranaerobius trueperi TaxID=759412 RepID=A0A226C193_9FIRM|nr:DUF6075 family protein [Natranaerobius trueperi]OWZ84384.1 hypothetical protein CDO51_03735 [Natranaerobius trueperi]